MGKMRALLAAIVFVGLIFSAANITTEGGNVTQVYFNGTANVSDWDGLYGEVILGGGVVYTHTVTGNQVVELDIVGQEPPCTYSSIEMYIIAANSSSIAMPLAAGNLAQLDAFMGGEQNGSSTFTGLETFSINSSTYNNVPTTYTYANGVPSAYFREGYFNDGLGNLVFVADVLDNRPNWNGSTSDYQIMLPNNGSGVQYWIWANVDYVCGEPPEPDDDEHELFILPIPAEDMRAGETIALEFTIENRGDYREDDIEAYLDCPAGFSCSSATLDKIGIGDEATVFLNITAGGPGSYMLAAHARNFHDHTLREFLLEVLPECEEGGDCGEGEYCEGGACIPKKETGEECGEGVECLSGLCVEGICALCEEDGDCEEDEACVGGTCEKVECPCGVVQNHACVAYECCADADCAENEFCIGNGCVDKELEIVLKDGEKIVGEEGLFQIINNRGGEVGGADVFTDEESTIADSNGYASLEFTPSGIIYADAEGYGQVAKIFDVVLLGKISIVGEVAVAGEETLIVLLDSEGNPIPGAEVFVEGKTLVTDEGGRISYVFAKPGEKQVSASKPGYNIEAAVVGVVEDALPEEVCRVPVVLNWVELPEKELPNLWLLSLILAAINFFLSRRRISRDLAKNLVEGGFRDVKTELRNRRMEHYLKGIGYSFFPVVLALPGVAVLNICFMSNVVAAQALGEIAIIAGKLLKK
ncbi:hypothetical protein GF415_00675 [Candidatus Micrarchaeota archaeon]|nr:hypothetical protein [Candidatus Micrarchaeota archaeon]